MDKRIKKALNGLKSRHRGMDVQLSCGLVAVPVVNIHNDPVFKDGKQLYALPGGIQVTDLSIYN